MTESTFATSGTDTIAYEVTEPGGIPVVLIHGWGSSKRDWDGVIQHLVPEFTVLTLDLPAHGESTTSAESVTIVQMADDVAAAMDAAGIERAAIVGHSMGGAIAAEFAARYPARASVLIGADTWHYLQLYPKQDEAGVDAFASSFAVDFPASVDALVEMSSIPSTPDEVKDEVRKSTLAVDLPLALTELVDLLRWDLDGALARVTAPIVSLVSDELVSDEAIDQYSGRMRFVRFPGVSHYLELEDPEGTARHLASAVRGL